MKNCSQKRNPWPKPGEENGFTFSCDRSYRLAPGFPIFQKHFPATHVDEGHFHRCRSRVVLGFMQRRQAKHQAHQRIKRQKRIPERIELAPFHVSNHEEQKPRSDTRQCTRKPRRPSTRQRTQARPEPFHGQMTHHITHTTQQNRPKKLKRELLQETPPV